MFLRNWDNIQAIKLVGAVETINPGIWGNASRTLKDYACLSVPVLWAILI
jgi:hypothetical protein